MSQCSSIIIDKGIGAPGHGKYVVDGINDVDNRYIYQLMSTFKLTGPSIFDSQMQMDTGNKKNDVSSAKEFQQRMKKEHRKNGVFDQGKTNKRFMERKLTDRQ